MAGKVTGSMNGVGDQTEVGGINEDPSAPPPPPDEQATQEAETEARVKTPEELQARINALEAQAAESAKKSSRDRNAQQTAHKKQQERDDALFGLGHRMESMEKVNNILIKHLVDGTSVEQLPADVGAIQLEAQQAKASTQFNSLARKYGEDIQQQVLGEDGKPILDLQEAPELEDVRSAWVDSVQAADITGVTAAYTEAISIIRQAERDQSKRDRENAVALERAAAREKMEDAGLNDLGTGPNASAPDADDLWGSSRIEKAVADADRRGKQVVSDVRPRGSA
tara:strand:+ start:487 stop:1335 length:849 start_codon:yes stop_codon:yes gene_type:complete